MTDLELFRATIAREPLGKTLFRAEFTPGLDRNVREACGIADGASLQEHFGLFTPEWVALRPPADYGGADFSSYYEGVPFPPGSSINDLGVMCVPGSEHHFTRMISPLRNAARFEDIERFAYPENGSFTKSHMVDAVDSAHAAGKVAAVAVGHLFEDAWQIRGIEPFLMDMAVRPEWCEYILDRVTERSLRIACAGAGAGADVLFTADDVATQQAMMFSMDQWRRFVKTRWARIYSAARAIKPDIAIWYHSDGNIEPIIPELIEIGVTILNPVQPECLEPVRIKREYGAKLVLDGTIGTQTTMPFGTPEEVRRVVRERVASLGYDGGLILSPTHVLEPDVPVANVIAYIEEAGECSIR